MNYEFDKDSKLPVYRQIADIFEKNIRSGTLEAGSKLPTVRELGKQFTVSNGTAIRTYDHLERLGLIAMNQGRGTFVLDVSAETANRKERAVSMIEKLITDLENMSFSPKEIEIFFGLILRERNFQVPNVRLGVVDCNPEALHIICGQLRLLEHAEIFQFLLENVQSSSLAYDEHLDLIATTATHYDLLSGKTNNSKQLLQISLSPSSNTIARLAQIPEAARVGICAKSMRFAHIVKKSFAQFASAPEPEVYLFDSKTPIEDFLRVKDMIILPLEHTVFCSLKQAELLKKYRLNGGIIEHFNYQVDNGSILHVAKEVEDFYKRRKTRSY